MLNLGFKTLNDLYKTSASDTFVKSLSLLIFIFASKDISLNPFKQPIMISHLIGIVRNS